MKSVFNHRKELKKLVQGMLVCDHVSHTLVEALLARMQELVTDQEARINQLAEIISDIRQPITTVQHSLNSDELRKLEVKVSGDWSGLHSLLYADAYAQLSAMLIRIIRLSRPQTYLWFSKHQARDEQGKDEVLVQALHAQIS